MNELLVALVNSILGSGKKTAGGNYAYTCPHCNHHKPKLEINFDSHKRGLHRGRMEAFRQVKPIYMYRDNNKDSKVDEVGKRYLENAYTNIHTNSYSRKTGILTWIVGKFSAGCVVVNNLTKYYDMIYSVDKNEYVSLCILKEF